MKVINVIIAEAALETIPPEISGHPAVVNSARLRGKRWSDVLLDISLHYAAMKRLPNMLKRGRPDIIHVALLEMLSSPLNIEGYLNTYIHTVNDYTILVDPTIRIPRNYMRFVGLMEQLFKYGQVPPKESKPLMRVVNLDFRNLLKSLNVREALTLSEGGELRDCETICSVALDEGLPIVVGGFPHGDFRSEVYESSKYVFSIYRKPLDMWVVMSRILGACEKVLGIM